MDMHDDNRLELIECYKKQLVESTNIKSSPDEMAVIDSILFRFWQMGWLKEQEAVMNADRRLSEMNDLLEIKESLIKHMHLENSRTNLNFDECAACPYRPSGQDTCDNLIPLLDGALSTIQKLEPHVIGLSEIEDGEGYWMTTMSSDFKPRPVICVHNEKDAGKPYIILAWQYGTFSWEAETYGIEWRLWSAKPIGREW